MVTSTTVKLSKHVDLMSWYIPMLFSRQKQKSRTRDCRKGERGRLHVIVQWGSVLIASIGGTFARLSCDE